MTFILEQCVPKSLLLSEISRLLNMSANADIDRNILLVIKNVYYFYIVNGNKIYTEGGILCQKLDH